MSAVINDSRNTIAQTTNQPGAVIFQYVQSQIALVGPGVLIYRIVGDNGVLCGFCAIQAQGGPVTLLFYQLRPSFVQFEVSQFNSEILGSIIIFIQQNSPLQDILY